MPEIVRYGEFERMPSKMAKTFGTIPKGSENDFNEVLFPMESNLLKVNRIHGANNGRRAMEAVALCLFKVDGYLNGKEYDLSGFVSPENEFYMNALLMAFDPFTNGRLRAVAEGAWDLNSPEGLRGYFSTPVKCLLRIAKSIDLWTKDYGAGGYFGFLEGQIGVLVPQDGKMDFTFGFPF
jgi:hypothetical protein